MIYNQTLTDSFINPGDFNIAGCRRLFLTDALEVTGYTVEDRQIVILNANEPFSLLEDLDGLNATWTPKLDKSGLLYEVEITFKIPELRADVDHLVNALMNTKYTAIYEDRNGRFRLLGFKQGLQAEFEASTESGGYSIKMTTRQVAEPAEVSVSVMEELNIFNYFESTTPNPVYTPQLPPSTGGGSGSAGNVFNSVNVTSTPYSVQDSDHFIKINQAGSVFLPATPMPGQMHIIKAYYDATVSPVVIVPAAGHKIDNQTSAQINTEYGALSLVFQSGHWSAVAFAI